MNQWGGYRRSGSDDYHLPEVMVAMACAGLQQLYIGHRKGLRAGDLAGSIVYLPYPPHTYTTTIFNNLLDLVL